METYATLLNLRIIVPWSRTRHIGTETMFWRGVMAPKVSNISFDEDWYLPRYPDVAEAIKRSIIASGKQHYVNVGYFENRMPYLINVDEGWYLEQYSDVDEAVKMQAFALGSNTLRVRGSKKEGFATAISLSR